MKKIPVIAFKNKSKESRYLAASMDVGDWSDEDLDVSVEDIENAFMIWKNDLSNPSDQDVEVLKAESAAHKKIMREKFGPDAMVTLDMEEILKFYEPVHLEITKDQHDHALEIASD